MNIPKPTNNHQTLIQKLLSVEFKPFYLERRNAEHENHQKKFISALYIAASKDKLNFISFCAPPVFVFYIFHAEIRDIYSLIDWWRKRQNDFYWRDPFMESNLFVRCLYDSINPPTENVICIHSGFSSSLFCLSFSTLRKAIGKDEDINPLFEIIQLFCFPQLFHLCKMKSSFMSLCGKSIAFDNEMRNSFLLKD